MSTWLASTSLLASSYCIIHAVDIVLAALYFRLIKFAAWSITMASYAHQLPYTTLLKYLSLFGIGAVLGCNAGCIINDMWDKSLDKAVGLSKYSNFRDIY